MELLNFCNTSDFKKVLVDNGYILKEFENLNLIKYDYNKNMKDNYQKYLKSTIFLDNKPICVSPLKSLKLNDEFNMENLKVNLLEIEIQELLDGTMINLFYDKDWIISTRSSIGGLNRWNNKKIKDLFMECCNFQNLKENLNKDYSYSFVLQHEGIRNISFIKENKLILVDVFDLKTLQCFKDIDIKFENLPIEKIKNIKTNLKSLRDIINKYIEDNKNNYNFKGLTFKTYNKEEEMCRYSYINEIYLKVKNELVVNDTNPLYIYSDLWKNNKLNDYLKIYSDKKESFLKYDNNLKTLLNDLLQTYHSLHIHKYIERKDVKYQLNPLLYHLHKLHINDNVYINYNVIKNYMKTIDTARLVFTLKYYN